VKDKINSGPSKQLSFRVKLSVSDQIEQAAVQEDLAVADFARKVFLIGLRQYERAGSLHSLRAIEDAAERARESVETDRRALDRVRRISEVQTNSAQKRSR
jgi:hypothetical protein